jgi:hypothetical protein
MNKEEYEQFVEERDALTKLGEGRGGLSKMGRGRLVELRNKLKDAHRTKYYAGQQSRQDFSS